MDHVFASTELARSLKVRALNTPEEWGPSDPVAQGNPALIYKLLFKAASQTLLEFGRYPRWLGGELGITMVLHTWGQNLGQHIHVHCIVTGGALSPDQQSWIAPARKGFLFPTCAPRSPRRSRASRNTSAPA